ncbi:MAG: hypothetical protein ACRD4S_12725 [Candidatus Acidiferrales bacterium]
MAKKKAAAMGYPDPPTLESCHGDERAYRREVELWQLGLDERVARKILDDAEYSHAYRDSAKRALRKCTERRNELRSKFCNHDGVRPPATATPAAELGAQLSKSRERTLREWLQEENQ